MANLIISLLAVSGIIYLGMQTFMNEPHQASPCELRYYIMCPMCNRVEQPIDHYGHCSDLCVSIFNEVANDE